MKKLLLALLILCLAQNLFAQEQGYHQHDGFYLSMALGPVFGSIKNETNYIGNQEYSGTGAQFDFKIGGAISENFIIHASLISSSMVGPKVSGDSGSGQASNDLSIGEAMIGAGITYYFMPSNFFLSGSVGSGNFSIMDKDNDINVSTDRGLAFQLKLGKEWWVSKNWGLGISVTYGKTNLTNKGGGMEEKLNSNRLGILFNTTFN